MARSRSASARDPGGAAPVRDDEDQDMTAKHHATLRAGKAPTQRQLRVGEELRHALADLFRRADFHDPELMNLNITVTEVRLSPDLKAATVFIMPLGGGDADGVLGALRRAAPFLRGQVARSVKLRHVPTLSFMADQSFEYAGRINTILHSPDVARDLAARNPDIEDADDNADTDPDTGHTNRGP
jgi:ribosome-binding factor A